MEGSQGEQISKDESKYCLNDDISDEFFIQSGQKEMKDRATGLKKRLHEDTLSPPPKRIHQERPGENKTSTSSSKRNALVELHCEQLEGCRTKTMSTGSPKETIEDETRSKCDPVPKSVGCSSEYTIDSALSSDKENGGRTKSEGLDTFSTFTDMDFDDWDDWNEPRSEEDLDLSQPCRCTIDDITRSKSKVVLLLSATQSDKKGSCHLEGHWMYMNMAIKNIVYVNAERVDGKWIVNNEHGLIVLEPDTLMSSTFVVGSVFCKRKSVLRERFGVFESTNSVMLVGTIVHSILQNALRHNYSDRADLERSFTKLVSSTRVVRTLYECDITLSLLKTRVFDYFPKICDFMKSYLGNSERKIKLDPDNWKGRIESIKDIEENIWCPKLGLKGKIDVTIESSNEIMPLEVKTGTAKVSVEHRGQVMLYLMMMRRVGYNVTSGLLLYLNNLTVRETQTTRNEERDLILLRNELMYHLRETPTMSDDDTTLLPPKLPEPINSRFCSDCGYNKICTVYASGSNEDISSIKTLNKIQTETLQYLSPNHIEYFIKWVCMLMIEGRTVNHHSKEAKNIFLSSPEDRETQGRCIANLIVTAVISDDDTFEHTFAKPRDGLFNFANSGIIKNNYVVVSTDTRYAIAAGVVTEVAGSSISVRLERNLDEKQTFCIDTYDSQTLESFQFNSLALLLESDPKAHSLRSIIIDKKPPTFKATIPKKIVTLGRSFLTKLNLVQQRAVCKAVAANEYFLIRGMPGTGKTATIVALIQLLVKLNKSVLITSHTNSAVDNVCLKLLKRGIKFIRLGTESRIHDDLKEHSEHHLTKNCSTPEEYSRVYNSFQIVAVTCMASGHPLLAKRTLDICIVDESTQVLQTSLLKPLRACNTFVLIGDADQLPAVVRSEKAKEMGMAESLFERLYTPEACISLNINYRMNKTITALANSFTYNDELMIGNDTVKNATVKLDRKKLEKFYSKESWIGLVLNDSLDSSVQFLDTGPVWNLNQDVSWKMKNCYAHNQSSSINIHEAAVVFKIVEALLISGVNPGDIGVIASYRHQVGQLTAILDKVNLDVNTVDQFQGKDKSVIIYSCGSSKDITVFKKSGKSDILEDKRRLTVAITRAKHKLIIVGDVSTLLIYSTFKKLLTSVDKNIIKLNECNDFVWDKVLDLQSKL